MTTNKAELQKDSKKRKKEKKSTKRHGEANAKTERSRHKKRVFKTKNVIKYHSTVIDNIINRRLYGTIYVVSISSNKHQNTYLFTKFSATFWTKISKLWFDEKREAVRGNTKRGGKNTWDAESIGKKHPGELNYRSSQHEYDILSRIKCSTGFLCLAFKVQDRNSICGLSIGGNKTMAV